MIWEFLFFLFAGKSYAMFALLFGLTFFIQMRNQEARGSDFRLRFAWRLLLLLFFGMLNSAFYQGDILTIYAVFGLVLIPVAKLSDRTILILATILFLQPWAIYQVIDAIRHPVENLGDPTSWAYFGKMWTYITEPSFWDTVIGNLTNGKKAVLWWSYESGRFFHIPALFMLGLWAGRKGLFENSAKNTAFWKRILLIATLIFLPIWYLQKNMAHFITDEDVKRYATVIETSWTNVAFMCIWVAAFYLAFQNQKVQKWLKPFIPIGSMSLSNYVLQSILGATLYYGFGFGLYKITGATHSFLIAILLSLVMYFFCVWWLKRHERGPLESIWHRLTWMGSKKG
jgi:uncharacterized protein